MLKIKTKLKLILILILFLFFKKNIYIIFINIWLGLKMIKEIDVDEDFDLNLDLDLQEEEFKKRNFSYDPSLYNDKTVKQSILGALCAYNNGDTENSHDSLSNISREDSLRHELKSVQKEIEKIEIALKNSSQMKIHSKGKGILDHEKKQKKELQELKDKRTQIQEDLSYYEKDEEISEQQMKMITNMFIQKIIIASKKNDNIDKIIKHLKNTLIKPQDQKQFFKDLDSECQKQKITTINLEQYKQEFQSLNCKKTLRI